METQEMCVRLKNDASRTWYMRLSKELEKLGVKVSRYDAGLFYWHRDGHLEGVITTHVDDICWGGSHEFQDVVVSRLHETFIIGTESQCSFTYLGLSLKQTPTGIVIDQNAYIQALQPLVFDKSRERADNFCLRTNLSKKVCWANELDWYPD